jgi:hypothetical protein
VGLVRVGDLVAIGGGILSVVLIEEGIAFGIFACGPGGRVGYVESFDVVCAWSWGAPISLVEPGLLMIGGVLLLDVPKNLGPTEYCVFCIIELQISRAVIIGL